MYLIQYFLELLSVFLFFLTFSMLGFAWCLSLWTDVQETLRVERQHFKAANGL